MNFYGDALAAANTVSTLRRASIDEHQPNVDEFLCACPAKRESRRDSLIQTVPHFAFGNDEFVKQRLVALAHAEIVAAVRALRA
jgi:hypothetical protein